MVEATTPIVVLCLLTLCAGIGQGTVSLACQNAVYRQASPARMGAAAGFLRTAGYVGSSIAFALFFGARADTHGLHELSAFVLVRGPALLLLTVLDRTLRRTDQEVAAP